MLYFQIGQEDIVAHRVVLAAASPYFVELFTRDKDGPSRKEIDGGGLVYELEGGFSKDSLERLIEYAYTSMYYLSFKIREFHIFIAFLFQSQCPWGAVESGLCRGLCSQIGSGCQ